MGRDLSTSYRCFGDFLSFNPRAHVGRDQLKERDWRGVQQFQSTRPRGARRCRGRPCRRRQKGFNPRAHVGRDSLLGNKLKIKFKDKHFRENIKTKRKMAANRRKNKSNQLILKHCECHKISCNGTRSQPPHTLGIVQQSQYQRIGNIDGGFLPDPFYSSFPIIS